MSIMKIIEKINHSDPHVVHIFKEGIFWIAYEQSAFFFWQQKGYKAIKKFVKTIGKEIVSIGFPQNTMEAFLYSSNTLCVLETDEPNRKCFHLQEAVDDAAFKNWKEQLTSQKENRNLTVLNSLTNEEVPTPTVEQRLKTFSLADSTPMECMLFLSKLQKELLNYS